MGEKIELIFGFAERLRTSVFTLRLFGTGATYLDLRRPSIGGWFSGSPLSDNA
ncbi:hypothetical protein [Rhizobium ruizarguesonis]|uniref:hypothetical protein n=1 Tax=Rhizobium ruizarguesonis TaxID=2081791 RepID=UPI0013EE83F5|nr:hypothetical protein [Rhizobium ruizarguesonis]